MRTEDVAEGLDRGEDPFALEQRVRAHEPAIADRMVVDRAAILRDGSRALLPRLGRPGGDSWLEPLMAAPIVGQPLWGHDGPVRWMRADGEILVTRGEDGRLRRFTARGECLEDRAATDDDDARRRGDLLVRVAERDVTLCDATTGLEVRRFTIERGDGYQWVERVRLLDDGTIGLYIGEDEPGSLYGVQYGWQRLDPLDESRVAMPTPDEAVPFAGGFAVALSDGTIRIVDDPARLRDTSAHRRVLVVALTADRFLSGGSSELRVHDRDGRLLAVGKASQPGMDAIVQARDGRIVTTSAYQGGASARPHARVWSASAEPAEKIEAGGGYRDLVSVDPTGRCVAFTREGALHLVPIGEGAGEPKTVPLTWHWNRAVAWSDDGERFAVQHHGIAPTVWSLDSGERERILTTDVLDTVSVDLSEDGALVLADHSFYELRAIRIDDGVAEPSLRPGFNLRSSAGRGSKGVAGGVEGGLWFDRATGRRVLHKKGAWVYACHVSEGLAAMAGDDGVRAIDLESGELRWHWSSSGPPQVQVAVIGGAVVCLDDAGTLRRIVDGEVTLDVQAHPRPGAQGLSLCALPDGTVLVGGGDDRIRRWDPEAGALVAEHPVGGDAVSRISAGGGLVLCRCTSEGTETWRLFELATGREHPLPEGARDPRLTPDGRRLVSRDVVARLDVIETRTALVVHRVEFGSWPRAARLVFDEHGHVRGGDASAVSDGVCSVEASPEGTITVRRGPEVVARWYEPRKWTCVAIDGDRVAAGDEDGRLALWRLHLGPP